MVWSRPWFPAHPLCPPQIPSTPPSSFLILCHSLMAFLPPEHYQWPKAEEDVSQHAKIFCLEVTDNPSAYHHHSHLNWGHLERTRLPHAQKKRGYRYQSTWYSCSMRCLLLPLQQKEAPPSQHALLLSDTLLTALTTSTCVKVHVCALGIYLWYWDPTQGFSMAGMCSVAELPRSSQTIFQYLAQSLLSRSLL